MSGSPTFTRNPITILVLLLLTATPGRSEQLPLRTYTTADGLPRDRVYRIVTDPRGFLWFCTHDGLSRFDGYEFVNYGVAHGLPHRVVSDLLISKTGDYWIATAGGLASFNAFAKPNQPKFKTYVASRAGAEVVTVLSQDRDGTIWVGTTNGLYKLREDGGDWQLEYVNLGEKGSERMEITSIVEDSPGVHWFGTFTGLVHHNRNGDFARFTTKDGLPHEDVRDIWRDTDGTVWVATGLGLSRLESQIQRGKSIVARLYNQKDGMLSEDIYDLFRTSTGWLWVATSRGLSEFSSERLPDGGHFVNYSAEHGLNDVGIQALAEDRDGNLWLGSNSGGAMKMTRRGFVTYKEADGLEHARISSIGEDQNGELFVITGSIKKAGFHIHQFDGRRFRNIKVNLPHHVIPTWGWDQLFLQDRMKQWWVPTAGGLFQFPALRSLQDFATTHPIKVYTSKNGLTGDEPFRLFEDSRGDVWISIITTPAPAYMIRWERATETFHRYESKDIASHSESAPTAFQEDRNQNLWIGFYWGSLARYRDGKFDAFRKEHGVPPGMIRDLHLDQMGRLWIATAEGGVARVDNPTQERPTFVLYTTKEGLSSDQITSITEDQWGRIYLGTGVGVDRLDPATGRVKRYTIADGLPNGFVNVSYRDRHNVLWFGTLQGLSKLVPSIDAPTQPPPILIQSVRVAGDELPISELGVTNLSNLEFEPNKNQLEIKFVSLGFLPGEVLRYQFMLEGADQEWSSPTNVRVINYANLRPGSYRFRVRAVNTDGLTSIESAFIAFTIIPPVWQRWWFVGLAGLLIVATAHLIYRYHTRRLIELERVRTRIATDLHDDIGASLSKIAILSEVAGQEVSMGVKSAAPNSLSEIAETSRDCVDAMSDIVWAVNPQRDHLSDLTQRMRRFAEDLLDAKDIDFSIRSSLDEKDVRLGADIRREVYLIFKECVNNLVKHSGCHKAALAFSIDRPWLVVSIADDGRGFKYDEPSHNGRAGMGGHGLLSMQQRAKAIGGSLKIRSEPGKGTSVTIRVRLDRRPIWRWWPAPTQKGGDA